jgi:hypothetical protein
MVELVFTVVFIAVIGTAMVTWGAVLVRRAARHQRELAAKRDPGYSQESLEDFIRRVDQVTAAEQLDHLDQKKRETTE